MPDEVSLEEYTPELFSLKLIQAINNWQRGEGPSKTALAQALKMQALKLPLYFRSTTEICYRRIDLDAENLFNVATKFKLPESISSWTKDCSIAKTFKELPAVGYSSSIYALVPSGRVILDLDRLFSEPAFIAKLTQIQGQVEGYADGIGLFANTEKEVLIECPEISADLLYAKGHFTKDKEFYLKHIYGPNPSDSQRLEFAHALVVGNLQTGPVWIDDPETIKRLTKKLETDAAKLVASSPRQP